MNEMADCLVNIIREKKMVKLSVIIPVYNREKYLMKCMDSVLSQTFRDMEIICVDDGSTDRSGEILNEYVQKDSRIKVFHQDNRGVVSARNVGISKAEGKYIGFIDSDDWIDPQMFEQLYSRAEQSGADLVTSGYWQEGNYTSQLFDAVSEGYYGEKEMQFLREHAIYHMQKKETGIRGSLWCKLFRTELLRKPFAQVPENLVFSEDKLGILTYLLDCKAVYIEKKAYYHYRIHSESTVHKADFDYLLHIHEVYRYLRSLYGHENFTADMRTQAELYVTELLLLGINQRMGYQNRNLLWVDPYWLDKIPDGSRVVLYGGGEMGRKYKKQLEVRGKAEYTACVDYEWEKYKDRDPVVVSPDAVDPDAYDILVITVKNPNKAMEIKSQLLEAHIPEEKILWFEQKDIFWKFAEAEGLLTQGKI